MSLEQSLTPAQMGVAKQKLVDLIKEHLPHVHDLQKLDDKGMADLIALLGDVFAMFNTVYTAKLRMMYYVASNEDVLDMMRIGVDLLSDYTLRISLSQLQGIVNLHEYLETVSEH